MTPPTGYIHAAYAGFGAVKVPDITTVNGVLIPGAVLGPGDLHVVSEYEAWESSNWTPCDSTGQPLPESINPLPQTTVEVEPIEVEPIEVEPESVEPDATIGAPPARGGKAGS